MSTRTVSNRNDPPIERREQLFAPMVKGEKPAAAWRIGTEHEKFVLCEGDHHAPSYDEPGGIRDLLLALTEFGWLPVEEKPQLREVTPGVIGLPSKDEEEAPAA